jgi:hypothetical protein
MSGGGGSSGTVQIPAFMESFHRALMGTQGNDNPSNVSRGMIYMLNQHISNDRNPFALNYTDPTFAYTDPTAQLNNAIGRFCLFNTLVVGLDPVTEHGTHLTGAIAQIDASGVLRDIDVSGLSAASRGEAGSAISGAFAAIPSGVGIDPASLFPTLFNTVVGQVGASGVLQNIDVDAIITAAQTAASGIITNAVGQLVDQIDPEADWQSYITQAVSGLSGVIVPINISSLTPITEAENVVDALIAKLSTPVEEDTDFTDALTNIVGAIGATGVLSTVDVSGIMLRAREGASLQMTEALDSIVTNIVELTDWDSFMTAVVAKADATGVLRNVDIDNIVTISQELSQADIAAALDDVMDAMSSADIAGTVTEFGNSLEYAKAKAMRRFAGAMSEINAVEGSAFLLGMAMIEAEHLQSIAKFNSDVRLSIFRDLITSRMGLFKDNVQYSLQAAIEDKRARDQFLLMSIEKITEIMRLRISYEQAQLGAHNQAMIAQAQYELNSAQSDKSARDALLSQSLQFQNNMIQTRVGLDQALVGAFNSVYQSYMRDNIDVMKANKGAQDSAVQAAVQQMAQMMFTEVDFRKAFLAYYIQAQQGVTEAHLRGDLQEHQVRAGLIQDGVRVISEMLFNREAFKMKLLDIYNGVYQTNSDIEFRARLANKMSREEMIKGAVQIMQDTLRMRINYDLEATKILGDLTRMSIVAKSEHEGAQMDLRKQYEMWGYEILQQGANLLSAGQGGSAFVPNSPSRAASVLSGALGGASAGAQFGPVGMGVGAVAGGLLGMIK